MKKWPRILAIIAVTVLLLVGSIFLVKKIFDNSNRVVAEFVETIDGDTAVFKIDGKNVKCRFLAIDTPEIGEAYYEEAKNYTNYALLNAETIYLESDNNADAYDKYERKLVWVFVDNELLEKNIIERGYGKVAYLYGDYKYTDILIKAQEEAKAKKIGIFQ